MLAFTFPGQGSQRFQMGIPWVDHPSWEVVVEASNASGIDIGHLLTIAPIEELTLTFNAQLATLTQSLVVLDAIERLGLSPAVCAGHSLGEYTSLIASGAIDFSEGLKLAVARGDAMATAAASNPGTMAALIGISDSDAQAACHRAESEVWVANYNAPGQIVIGGSPDGIDKASEIARRLGAKRVIPLQVSGAFHTPLMMDAKAKLREALSKVTFKTPEVPVVSNVDAHFHDDPDEWPSLLSAQLCSPVLWRQGVEALISFGATTLVELGPGGILSGLAHRIAPELQTLSVSTPDDLDTMMDLIAPTQAVAMDPLAHHGEHLYISERVVVSSSSGIFSPEESLHAPGAGLLPGTGGMAAGRTSGESGEVQLHVGDLVGKVGITDVRTPFEGVLVRWLATAGERVQVGQPLLWMRVQGEHR